MAKHPAIFLDRDGTIIEDNGYINKTSEVIFYPHIYKVLEILQKYFLLFVITNQSGISKGLISESEVQAVNKYITETLKANGITIFDTFCCPHKNKDNCNCKKPKPYFIKKAAQLTNGDLTKSYIIGDHPSDVECGINAGVTPIYLLSGRGKKHKDELIFDSRICKNLYYKLVPNHHKGVWKVRFKPQLLMQEYLTRRGNAKLRSDQYQYARCPLLGFELNCLTIEGAIIPSRFLQVHKQVEVETSGYDAGGEILYDFFRAQLQKYLTPQLHLTGRRIVETCLRGGSVED